MITAFPSNSWASAKICRAATGVAFLAVLAVAGCAQKPAPTGDNDPREAENREVHAFNRAVDKAIVKPLSGGYGSGVPAPVKQGVVNFAGNLDLPGDVLNNLVQGRPHHALENTFRFVLNTTVGIGGLFDPARAIGVDGKPTDFGETLHVYGVGEGNFVELPFVGPSTERDMVGIIVDMAANPLNFALPAPERYYANGARIFSRLGDRARYSDTVDSVLYESADSYAQSKLLYMQNRRFELGQTTGDDAYIDPYEDLYAE